MQMSVRSHAFSFRPLSTAHAYKNREQYPIRTTPKGWIIPNQRMPPHEPRTTGSSDSRPKVICKESLFQFPFEIHMQIAFFHCRVFLLIHKATISWLRKR